MSDAKPFSHEPAHYSQIWAYRTPRARLALWFGWLALVALFIYCWQVMNANTMWVFVGKLLYEAIEETDARQIEAVTATGAGSAQVLDYAIVPQLMPAFWGISVFRWDINIRESTILGLVGAGGIGLKLQASINTLAWPQVSTILIVILATVIFSEWVSARVRHAIL